MKLRRWRPRLKLAAAAPLGLAAMIVLPDPIAQDSSQSLRCQWPTDCRPAVPLTASGLRVSSHTVCASRAGLARGGRAGAEIKRLAHGITCENGLRQGRNTNARMNCTRIRNQCICVQQYF